MSVSDLYEACRNGHLDTAEQLLPTLTLDEINRIEPNGSTSLHAACYFNHPQIVKLLLDYGALRTTKNSSGCTAFDEASTEQVKKLFPRPFADAQARFSSELLIEQTIEWTSLDNGKYGWLYKQKINNRDVDKAVDAIVRDETFSDTCTTNIIDYLLSKARRTQDPTVLAQAYSTGTGFSQALNKALALGSWDPIEFNEEVGFYSFVGIFLRHDTLKNYRYAGKCYRGMKLSTKDFEENYQVGQKLLIKPFISTSKRRDTAEKFATAPSIGSRPLSVLYIYTIPERTLSYDDNVALDISTISEYPDEEEVLILPYTSLKVQSINHLSSGLIEIEMGWYSFIADSRPVWRLRQKILGLNINRNTDQ